MRTADLDLQRRRATEIATAAARAFLAKGFHGTSMQDVAREAGVSMGLLYRYYADKAALIAAAATVDRADLLAKIAELADKEDPVSALKLLAQDIIAAAREPGYVELIAEVAAEACRNPLIAAVLQDDESALSHALAAALSTHRDAGRLRADADLKGFAILFLSLADALALRVRLAPNASVDPQLRAFAPAIEALRP